MVKTTNLCVTVVVLACHNFSLIALLEVNGFKSAIAMAYGYDESRHAGPRGETQRRARERPWRALARSQIAASGRQPATTCAHECRRLNRHGTVEANRPWPPYADAAYGDGGGHDQVA